MIRKVVLLAFMLLWLNGCLQATGQLSTSAEQLVEVHVQDTTGSDLENALIQVVHAGKKVMEIPDLNGGLFWVSVEQGKYYTIVRKSGYSTVVDHFNILENSTFNKKTIKLAKRDTADIRFQVFQEGRENLTGINVSLVTAGAKFVHSKSNGDGVINIGSLAAGRYHAIFNPDSVLKTESSNTLAVNLETFPKVVEFEIRSGDRKSQSVLLTPVTGSNKKSLILLLLDAQSLEPVANATVVAKTDEGMVLLETESNAFGEVILTNFDAPFESTVLTAFNSIDSIDISIDGFTSKTLQGTELADLEAGTGENRSIVKQVKLQTTEYR